MFLLKKNHPKNVMPPSKRRFLRDNTEEQAELNRVDNDDHVIPMENDYINNSRVDDDGTNRLIQDIFNAPMDDDVNLERTTCRMIRMTVMKTMMMTIFLIKLSLKMPLNPSMKAQKKVFSLL